MSRPSPLFIYTISLRFCSVGNISLRQKVIVWKSLLFFREILLTAYIPFIVKLTFMGIQKEKVFSKASQNSQENTCARVSFEAVP